MKKLALIFMICTFTGCLLFGTHVPTALAAEKAKYSGILKFNSSKAAGIFGDPLKTFAFNHGFCEVALQCLLRPSKKGEKIFDALEWLATMCSHVPNKGEQMVRYYGHYSNVARGKRKKQDQELSIFASRNPHTTSCDRVLVDIQVKTLLRAKQGPGAEPGNPAN